MQIDPKHHLTGNEVIQKACPKNTQKFEAGLPDTIVIHFTAGRSAESSANYLSSDVKASAHLVIGRAGEIYQLVAFDTIAWHAGESQYGGRTGLNKYSIGIELDNAGELKRVGTEYQAWFGARYQPTDVLYARHRNETTRSYWQTYTQEQIDVCEQVCQLLIEKYGIKTIVGHEEIAPTRKRDPGPAFPLDKFRQNLLSQNRTDEPDETGKEAVVTGNQLNIRAGAGVDFPTIAPPLAIGIPVKVLEEKEGWVKVETKITGWVSKAFLKFE
ncbi:MAG: N-acetylmuramoyl-L-alanine amidase [Bacteroidetes bacterium HGW-Bacteroidetes-16]|jgi:N-acetylmuramoyl-L-alanine amidase|nr:MAG: N-acetylmuramoyl-L-alanine amidase [Bacteroidetes bacterium HGW-Bacteroidetes-16]